MPPAQRDWLLAGKIGRTREAEALTHWFIVKTDTRMIDAGLGRIRLPREVVVCSEMRAMGFESQVPCLLTYYRTAADRAHGKRSVKSVPAIRGLVFVKADHAVPVGHVEGVREYMRLSDYEYCTVPDYSFRRFAAQIEAINEEIRQATALQYALLAKKAKKEVMKFQDGLQLIKARMEAAAKDAA